MNFKNIFMIMIVLFIAFGISAVSAEDITNDNNAISDSNGYSAIESNIIESELPTVETGVTDTLNETEIIADNVVYPNGEKKEYSVKLLSNGTPLVGQNITFFIDNELKSTSTTDENGTAVLDVEFLQIGSYVINCKFAGNAQYNASEATATVSVCNSIFASDLTKYCRNATPFTGTFYDENGTLITSGKANFTIAGGKTYTKDIVNGKAALNINLDAGKYKITLKNLQTNETAVYNITVLTTIMGNNVTKYYRNASQFHTTILDAHGNPIEGRNITININGIFYKRTTDNNGSAELAIRLGPAKLILTVKNLANNEERSFIVDVLSTINATDYKTVFQSGGKFTFTVLDGQGKPMANQKATLNINGVIYDRVTDSKGSASLNINLYPGKYVCTVTANGLAQGYNVEVTKRTPEISFISTTVKTGGKLECKFTYNKAPIQNRVVYFLFNGTEPHAVYTNSEGIGAVILNIPAGNYLFYVGIDDIFYANKFIASTITVTK